MYVEISHPLFLCMLVGGGDADTTAAMTGALCGALHGCHWIPEQW